MNLGCYIGVHWCSRDAEFMGRDLPSHVKLVKLETAELRVGSVESVETKKTLREREREGVKDHVADLLESFMPS